MGRGGDRFGVKRNIFPFFFFLSKKRKLKVLLYFFTFFAH